MDRIGFVILTWNSEKYIENCLKSLFQINGNEVQINIVVVDNASEDNTNLVVGKIYKENNHKVGLCHLIKLKKNFGTTYSRNLGISYLEKQSLDYICILDSDTIVNAEAIKILMNELKQDELCGIVGPKMYNSSGIYQRSGRDIPTLTEKFLKALPFKTLQKRGNEMEASILEGGNGCVKVGYLMSACWVMRAGLFDKIGNLDEKIFYAPEDVEFCIRCWKAGLSVKYCYDAEIVHEWQRLSRKKLFSKHNLEHIKGLLYMFWKHKYLFNTKKIVAIDH